MQQKYRYSKVFRHACKALLIYLMAWAIAILALLIGALFDCFQEVANLILFITPHLLKLGCILGLGFIVAVIYEGIREDVRRDD